VKNLFLSGSHGYNWNRIKNWNVSAKRTKHDLCNVLLNPDQELIKKCDQNGYQHSDWYVNNVYKPHNVRFLFKYKYLMSVSDQYKNVIVTDSSDVYFHTDPFPKLEKLMQNNSKKIVCGSESIIYKNEQWGDGNLKEGFGYIYDEYKNNEICNVGVLCGEIKAVAELCLLIFTMCIHNPASVSDQSSFNVMMGTQFFKDNVHMSRPSEGLMVHLGTVGIEKFRPWIIDRPVWDDDDLPSVDGSVFPIIHQYNRIPNLNTQIDNICDKD
jgi:hypothetical protein